MKQNNKLLHKILAASLLLLLQILISTGIYAADATSTQGQLTKLDLAKGSISIEVDTITGYDEQGNKVTAVNENGYHIIQSDNATATANTIKVETDTTIILDGIFIRNDASAAIRISLNSAVHLILGNGSTNKIERTKVCADAMIQVTMGSRLVIGEKDNGTGSLNINGGNIYSNVGIGGGNTGSGGKSCGDVTIHNGNINISGVGVGIGQIGHTSITNYVGTIAIDGGMVDITAIAVGIGMQNIAGSSDLTAIDIKGGIVKVKATNTSGVAIGVMDSEKNSAAKINISGGNVTAEGYYQSDAPAACGADIGMDMGSGMSMGSLAVSGGSVHALNADKGMVTDGKVPLYQLSIENASKHTVEVEGTSVTTNECHEDNRTYLLLAANDYQVNMGGRTYSYVYDPSRHTFTTPKELKPGEALDIGGGNVTVVKDFVSGVNASGEICYSYVAGQSASNYLKVTGQSDTYNISVTGSTSYIELENVSVDMSGKSGANAMALTGGVSVNLKLTGKNNLIASGEVAALWVDGGTHLTIVGESQGSLDARCISRVGAGIGSNRKSGAGKITIHGGDVTASSIGRGVDSTEGASMEAIEITGGTVTTLNQLGENTGSAGSVSISGGAVNCASSTSDNILSIGAKSISISGNPLITLHSRLDGAYTSAETIQIDGGIIRERHSSLGHGYYVTKILGKGTERILTKDLTNVTSGDTRPPDKLIVGEGATLRIPSGVTLSNGGNIYIVGTLLVEGGGQLRNEAGGNVYQSGILTGGGTINTVLGTHYFGISSEIAQAKGSIGYDSGTVKVEEGQGGTNIFAKAGDTVSFTVHPVMGNAVGALATVSTVSDPSQKIAVTGDGEYGKVGHSEVFTFVMPGESVTIDANIKISDVITLAKESIERSYTGEAVALSMAKGTEFTWNCNGTAVIEGFYVNQTGTKTTAANSGSATEGGAPKNTGTYYVKVTVAGDDVYVETTSGYLQFVILKSEQSSLSFTGVPEKVDYGTGSFNLSTAGGSGTGAVTYKVTAGDAVSVAAATGAVTVLKAGSATVTATKAGDNNYNDKTDKIEITVAPVAPTLTFTPTTTQTLTYTGSPAAITVFPKATGISGKEAPTGTVSYAYKIVEGSAKGMFADYTDGLPTGAGKYKIKARIAAAGNYTQADSTNELDLTIQKSTPALSIKTMNGKLYDGTNVSNPTAEQVTVAGAAYTDITFVYSRNNDMSSPLTEAPKAAGTYYVQARVNTGNNTNAAESQPVSFTIAKGNAAGVSKEYPVVKEYAATYQFDLGILLPTLPSPQEYGKVVYTIGEVGNADGVLTSAPLTSDITADGKLPLKIANTKNKDKTATVSVSVTAENFTISDALITIKTTDRTPLTISGVSMQNRVYDGTGYAYSGNPVCTSTIDNTPVTDVTVIREYEGRNGTGYAKSEAAPINAGDYNLILTVGGTSAKYYTGTLTVPFSINKRELLVKAANKEAVAGAALKSLANPVPGTDYTVTGLVGADTISGVSMGYVGISDTSFSGSYPITISGGTVSNNYSVRYEGGTLTVIMDTTLLTAAIKAAKEAQTGVAIYDAEASAVAKDTRFVTTAEMNTLHAAIKTAEDAKASTSLAQVQAATKALNDAVTVYRAAIKTGTYVAAPPVDISLLTAAITAAGEAQTGVAIYDAEASAVAKGTRFVTTAEMNTLHAAIKTAEDAKASTSLAQVQAAAKALDDAVAVYRAAIKTGTYVAAATPTVKTGTLFSSGSYAYKVTSKDKVLLNGLAKKKTVTKVTVPKTVKYKNKTYQVTGIADKAFYKNTKIKEVNLGSYITSIGKKAFYRCSKLTSVTMGNKVTTISDQAFYKCTSLKKVNIGTGLKTLGKEVFSGCTKLTSVTIKSKKLTKVGTNTLKYCKNLKIKVPSSKVKAYTKLFSKKGQKSNVKIVK